LKLGVYHADLRDMRPGDVVLQNQELNTENLIALLDFPPDEIVKQFTKLTISSEDIDQRVSYLSMK